MAPREFVVMQQWKMVREKPVRLTLPELREKNPEICDALLQRVAGRAAYFS